MVVDMFEGDEFVGRYPLVAAGHPRVTPTPQGEFRVLEKYERVFSRSAQVWMPWSLRFYGQYYIHEIPYYPSGAKVRSTYSHGCLRLYEGNAQELYNWASVDTKVHIINAKLAREEDEERIYYLTDNGFKKPIFNVEVFYSYDNNPDEVKIFKDGRLDAYPKVELIRGMDGSKVYKLEENKKRWIKSPAVFNNLGYNWQEIVSVNQIELNAWPTGEPIET
jgi:hypothetical protein